jgi:hypothetical protein
MAAIKRCEEEFNPWPPFVDIFSSVILVLMLFLLIVIVNLAYYMKYKVEVRMTGNLEVTQKLNATTAAIQKTSAKQMQEVISKEVLEGYAKKVKELEDTIVDNTATKSKMEQKLSELSEVIRKMKSEAESDAKGEGEKKGSDKQSLFEGGKDIGNAVKRQKSDVFEGQQSIEKVNSAYLIVFHDNEVFISKEIFAKISSALKEELKRNSNAKFTLSVADTRKVLGPVMARQISLGRILNVKNLITKRAGIDPKKVTIHYSARENEKVNKTQYINGYVKVQVQ